MWIFLILKSEVNNWANFLFLAIINIPDVSLSILWTINGFAFSKYLVFLIISIIFLKDFVPDWTGIPEGLFKTIKSNEGYSFLELNPITGRKHQLRKQLLNIGNPIVGDDKYFLNDRKKIKMKNLMLHAYKIKFMINNVRYNFKAKYNEAFENFLNKNF